MIRDKLTISSVRRYLRDNLSAQYPPGELNAVINIILSFISGKDRTFMLINPGHEISSYNWFKVNKICADLKNMMPVQYITGESEFYGIKLQVTRDTLIPRQETEELVDLVIKENIKSSPRILDLGTGTGCIAISLAVNIKGANVTATDYSNKTLRVAALNALKNNADILYIKDDILNPGILKYGQYDVVVCNPPYITESEKSGMAENVLNYEPHKALFVPDGDPLIFYRAVLELNNKILKKGGTLYFEINENKTVDIKKLLVNYQYANIEIVNDINAKARISKSTKG
ncbi:MAG TPA: peptide chain release factor N(5)-glutamine methyltransferase [Bacteroidales bacterium]|nr:peptide chain release factor N(5)-glutamine methyltransferase [Bacteroidales bacterium]